MFLFLLSLLLLFVVVLVVVAVFFVVVDDDYGDDDGFMVVRYLTIGHETSWLAGVVCDRQNIPLINLTYVVNDDAM